MTTAASPKYSQALAEELANAFFARKLGYERVFFESNTDGIIAMERCDPYEDRKFRYDELAAELARGLGIAVCTIQDCDWTFSDRCDEEATMFVFDHPSVSEDDKNEPYRNILDDWMRPEEAPSAEDFVARDKAIVIAESRIEEITGKLKRLEKGAPDYAAAVSEVCELRDWLRAPDARNRDVVVALVEQRFDDARAAYAAATEEPAEAPSI